MLKHKYLVLRILAIYQIIYKFKTYTPPPKKKKMFLENLFKHKKAIPCYKIPREILEGGLFKLWF